LEKANDVLPDLIMLDVIMPYMNGFDVLVELKKIERTKNIPIIFITGMRESSSEFAGLSIGAIDYIRKPLDSKITKLRVQHQIKIINLQRELEREAETAYMASQAKSAFLANMSHEIRTPMNSILGFSELALDDEDVPPKTKKHLTNIRENTEGLLQIINDILDISKIESGKMELEHVPFDPEELLAICRTIIMPKAISKGLDIGFSAEPIEGKLPVGDPTRIRQIIINLLSNAVKFTETGAVSLTATLKKATEDTATVLFEVKDTGIGISDEQIDRIFSPFLQGDVKTTRKFGGTGLGLTITKNLLEMMGSKLVVISTPGVGTVFSFELTFEIVDLTEEERQKLHQSSDKLKKPTFEGEILLCEDDHMSQIVIEEHLSRVGIKTVIAQNGRVGLDLVKNRAHDGRKQFDLIFMDMHMPLMDGLEAAEKIFALNLDIPIVAMTANVMPDDKDIYESLGIDDCVSKPFTSQELWQCLLKYLEPITWKEADDIKEEEAE